MAVNGPKFKFLDCGSFVCTISSTAQLIYLPLHGRAPATRKPDFLGSELSSLIFRNPTGARGCTKVNPRHHAKSAIWGCVCGHPPPLFQFRQKTDFPITQKSKIEKFYPKIKNNHLKIKSFIQNFHPKSSDSQHGKKAFSYRG